MRGLVEDVEIRLLVQLQDQVAGAVVDTDCNRLAVVRHLAVHRVVVVRDLREADERRRERGGGHAVSVPRVDHLGGLVRDDQTVVGGQLVDQIRLGLGEGDVVHDADPSRFFIFNKDILSVYPKKFKCHFWY